MIKLSRLVFDRPAHHLLFLAALCHLIMALGLYSIGRFAVIPSQVDDHGVLARALPDSAGFRDQAIVAGNVLRYRGARAWLAAPSDAHVKLYSLSFLTFGRLVGANILGAEPLNLCCYLGIVCLTFILGREVFDERVGRIAAWMVAMWPSFLLHTIQILKDPICLIAMLVLMLTMAFWLTRALSWRKSLFTGLMGMIAIGLLYSTRSGFWVPIVLGLVLIGAALLVIRLILERSLLPGNVLSMVLVLIFSMVVLSVTEDFFPKKRSPALNVQGQTNQASAPAPVQNNQGPPAIQTPTPVSSGRLTTHPPPPGRTNYLVIQIQQVRDSFVVKYKESGTLVDSEVEFITLADVILYVPRAMEIGFLAPFPSQWIVRGVQAGRSARLISGAEMLVTYAIEIFALFGVWRSRYRLSAWLLVCLTLFGVTTLALGLINVGALYRMRYAFFLLLIILGSNGLRQLVQTLRAPRVASTLG